MTAAGGVLTRRAVLGNDGVMKRFIKLLYCTAAHPDVFYFVIEKTLVLIKPSEIPY